MQKNYSRALNAVRKKMLAAGIAPQQIDALLAPLAIQPQRRLGGLAWNNDNAAMALLKSSCQKLPYLSPVPDKNIVQSGTALNHVLIEGENLLALILLGYTHIDSAGNGLVDVIYIDPPYDTGNSHFPYKDKFASGEWLTMMEARLRLSRNLLREDGVIFISLDDNNLYEAKLLLDNIFKGNHLATICVEISKTQGMKVKAAQDGRIVKNHEYILAYAKNLEKARRHRCPLYDSVELFDIHYKYYMDEDLRLFNLAHVIAGNDHLCALFAKYDFKPAIENVEKMVSLCPAFKNWILENSKKIFQSMNADMEIPPEVRKNLAQGMVVRHNRYLLRCTSSGRVEQLKPLADALHKSDDYIPTYGRCTIRGALWKGFYSDMMNVAKEGGVEFKNGKKPKRLIRQLIKWANRPEGLVLDFFAGSGTTLHAVMEQNAEDQGHRQCILCTNNELGPENLKIARKKDLGGASSTWEALGVCQAVAYPRIRNAILGYGKSGSKCSAALPGNNLYYYQVNLGAEITPSGKSAANSFASKNIACIALKENAFNIEYHEAWARLYSEDKEIIVALDSNMDMAGIQKEIMSKTPSPDFKTHKIYCPGQARQGLPGVTCIPYPQEALTAIKAIQKLLLEMDAPHSK